jgi:vacuolar-type H+-ATPase subunit F/Vma7
VRKILFITPPDAGLGFSLAGAAQRTASPEQLLDILHRALQEPEVGLVAVDERLLTEEGRETLQRAEQRFAGVIVVLPAPELPGVEAADYAMDLIRRAVGYHLRLSV